MRLSARADLSYGNTRLHARRSALLRDAEYERLLPVIGVRAWVGPLSTVPSDLKTFAPQVVVASPGFAPTHAVIAWAQDAGIAVWGDIELAWRVRDKVVRADGSLAKGERQRRLLEDEGVAFRGARVDMRTAWVPAAASSGLR